MKPTNNRPTCKAAAFCASASGNSPLKLTESLGSRFVTYSSHLRIFSSKTGGNGCLCPSEIDLRELAIQGSCFAEAHRRCPVNSALHRACDATAWAALILLLRLMSVIFVCCIDSAILFLCVERVYCTLRIRRYEESSRTTLLATLCVIATASWSIAYYLLLSPGLQWEERIAVATVQNPQNAGGYKIMLLSVLVMEPASLAFIVLIRVWNQRVRQRIRSEFIDTTRYERLLSMKFQTEETIRVTSMFIPIVATKVFFTAFSAVSIFIANNLVAYQQADLATKMFLYEAFQQNYLQSVVMPLFLMYKTDQMSRLFAKPRVTPREYMRGSVAIDNFETHFTRLQLIFEGDIPSHEQPTCKGCFLS